MPKVNPYTKPRSNASRVIARTKALQTDRRTDGQTDRRTDRRTDGRTGATTIPFRPKGRRVKTMLGRAQTFVYIMYIHYLGSSGVRCLSIADYRYE